MKLFEVISRCFDRNKKPLFLKVLAVLCYYQRASLRDVRDTLEPLCVFSHESVRLWWHKIKPVFSPEKKERKLLALDETKIKVNGTWIWIWAIIDCDSKEILATLVSHSRSAFETYRIMKLALKHCTNKPLVLVDGAPWYKWAFEKLGIPWKHVTRGKRNIIERWFRTLKRKTKTFFNNFRGKNIAKAMFHVQKFLHIFVSIYNLKKVISNA